MTNTRQNRWKNWTIGAVLAGGLVFGGSAGAHDRISHHDHDRHVRKGHAGRHDVSHSRIKLRTARRENRRLDHQGALIDLKLDGLALLAAAHGEYELAHVLDRTGDRIQRRLDRKGDRNLRQVRRHVRSHRRTRPIAHVNRIKRSKRGHHYDLKRNHADWLRDRARDSDRNRRHRHAERWDH